jgi:isoquinoline 1-oxidoreductase beta subunit
MYSLCDLHPDNSITFYVSRSEMGQGVTNLLAQYFLEELDAAWHQIDEVKQAYACEERFGPQRTTASISSFEGWYFHRQAGARLRLLLLEGAAKAWKVPVATLRTKEGKIFCDIDGRSMTFGEAAAYTTGLALSEIDLPLRQPEEFRLIGKSFPRLDAKAKVTGKAIYGIDVRVPGMATAVVARCPVFGGRLRSYSLKNSKTVKGFIGAVLVSSGLAVVADSFWAAKKARDLIEIEWDEGSFAGEDSRSIVSRFYGHLDNPETIFLSEGQNVDEVLGDADKILEATFEFPFVAHMTMEPMNCTAHVKGDGCEIWAPTQSPGTTVHFVSKHFGWPESAITLNTTLMGGGFGRRAQEDFVIEAVEISQAIGRPVQVIWTREDDIQHDYYRTLAVNRIAASVDERGHIVSWDSRLAAMSAIKFNSNPMYRNKEGGDGIVWAGAEPAPYRVPNYKVHGTLEDRPMPIGILRGISHGYTSTAKEMFLDELCEQLGEDQIEFRKKNIGASERARYVLRRLGELLKKAEQRGVSVGFAYGAEESGDINFYHACLAEVQKGEDGSLSVTKISLVLDNGVIVNLDGVRQQAEGAAVFALSMLFHDAITVRGGAVEQSNFHDYGIARIGQEPEVVVELVDSQETPMGMGERLQGVIQPAVLNALYRATGTRVRRLPVDLTVHG